MTGAWNSLVDIGNLLGALRLSAWDPSVLPEIQHILHGEKGEADQHHGRSEPCTVVSFLCATPAQTRLECGCTDHLEPVVAS